MVRHTSTASFYCPLRRQGLKKISLLFFTAPFLLSATNAFALPNITDNQTAPTGGQIISGTGNISQTDETTTINQSSDNVSVNWQSFNIAPQHTVNFVQPSASSLAVNHILDNNGSQIFGHLNANGQVFLINPNGIYFGRDAQVNVGGLVASTLNFDDSNLGNAVKTFSGYGTGSIVNKGTLTTTEGGYVALLSNTISNEGTINAQLGNISIGAGNTATLTFNDNKLLDMQVSQSTLDGLTEKNQLIQTGDGQVVMTDDAKDQVLAGVVNLGGVIEASKIDIQGGSVALTNDVHGLISTNLDLSASNIPKISGALKIGGALTNPVHLSTGDFTTGNFNLNTVSTLPTAQPPMPFNVVTYHFTGRFAGNQDHLIKIFQNSGLPGLIKEIENVQTAQNAATQLTSNLTSIQDSNIAGTLGGAIANNSVTEPALTIMQDGIKLPGTE